MLDADAPGGWLGSARADDAVTDDARGLLALGRTETLTYGPDGQRRGEGLWVFLASYAPRPRMLVFGAIDFAAAVARVGSFLGYQVTVCDARPGCSPRRPGSPRPTRWWWSGRTGTCRPQAEAGARLAHGDHGADPRPRSSTCRCSSWHCAISPSSPSSARWVRGAPMTTGLDRLREAGLDPLAQPGCPQPDRAGPRGTYARGDRGVDRRRDHRPALGRRWEPAPRPGGADPPPPLSGLIRRRRDDSPVSGPVERRGSRRRSGGCRRRGPERGPGGAHAVLAPLAPVAALEEDARWASRGRRGLRRWPGSRGWCSCPWHKFDVRHQ